MAHKRFLLQSATRTHGELERLDVLYLPTSGGRLVPSTEIVFNDDPLTYAKRIRALDRSFLISLSECGMGGEPSEWGRLMELLPARLRPLLLSSIVNEVSLSHTQRVQVSLCPCTIRLV